MVITPRLIARFWSHVEKSDGCWTWKSTSSQHAYGSMSVDNKSTSAHRISWEIANGPIPDGLFVLHRCDNKACVRPDHLFLGTQAENIADRDAKGRNLVGARSPRAKLTEEQVQEILATKESSWKLAARFGVSPSTVKAVRTRQNWKRTTTPAVSA